MKKNKLPNPPEVEDARKYRPVLFYIPEDVHQPFKVFCAQNKVPMSKVVTRLMVSCMENSL